MQKRKKILFIVPYPFDKAPSQRFRVEQYFPVLDEAGFEYKLASFMDVATWEVLYKKGSPVQKGLGIVKGFIRRLKHVFWDIFFYDTVFIHRETSPIGPPIFEWIITRVFRRKTIYDFDDAIWIPNISTENSLVASLKSFWKIAKICSWATTVIGGNAYLCRYAVESGASDVVLIPTVVDTLAKYTTKKSYIFDAKLPVIGWTGSHSTLKYLDEIVPVFQKLEKELEFEFLVIADKNPELPFRNFSFIPWSSGTEIKDLERIDIGIMPLTDDLWSEGKCGFKLIQYMALGIPSVAAPVGVNKTIIQNDMNGYCLDIEDWPPVLKRLIGDAELRTRIGLAGKETVDRQYSLFSQQSVFLDMFT